MHPTEVRRLTYTLSCGSFILPLGKAGHFQCKLSEQIIPSVLPSSAQDPAPAGLSLALFSAFPHPPPPTPGQVVK
jgi:hypothetical protein